MRPEDREAVWKSLLRKRAIKYGVMWHDVPLTLTFEQMEKKAQEAHDHFLAVQLHRQEQADANQQALAQQRQQALQAAAQLQAAAGAALQQAGAAAHLPGAGAAAPLPQAEANFAFGQIGRWFNDDIPRVWNGARWIRAQEPGPGAQLQLGHVMDVGGLRMVFNGLNLVPEEVPAAGALAMAAPAAPPRPGVGGFASDRQNIHRSETVKFVLDMFDILTKQPLEPGQNTVADIIRDCNLPPRAIINLTQYYYEPIKIYEIERAYPRALDGIWAFISRHKEKKELCERVKEELTDNVGMCAQGNLTRLCNILSGYIEGGPVLERPKGEILQEKMAAIAAGEVTDDEKRAAARILLGEMAVPEAEWDAWIEAL
jgi:hypothetical protein